MPVVSAEGRAGGREGPWSLRGGSASELRPRRLVRNQPHRDLAGSQGRGPQGNMLSLWTKQVLVADGAGGRMWP